ncbi:MAG: phosphopantothenoylcysteine decarboxylase [bacterium]|nr:phosphopantothenoylcysteine decarboxylase [bacterium]
MKILITAGPTREYIDAVRFISNPATGTLGYLTAEIAKEKKHDVVLVSGPCYLKPPKGIKIIFVESAIQMKNMVEREFPSCDALVMTAAVSDWRPERKFGRKLKIKRKWKLNLIPNPDILKCISRMKKEKQIVFGFALESENIIENAKRKMKEKNLDVIIANTVKNFGKPRKKSDIFAIYSDGSIKNCSSFTKNELAFFIVSEIERLARGINWNK